MRRLFEPTSIAEIQQALTSLEHLHVAGGGTKPALSGGANLSTRALAGVLEYEPSEYTMTALAGTPLREIADRLHENKQFMPFDPPLLAAGATLGGTVASGGSGSGRVRYGGLRDFLLGVRIVTGGGRVVFGGGKVVKNAAGFDIPKLMVGGLGTMAVLVEFADVQQLTISLTLAEVRALPDFDFGFVPIRIGAVPAASSLRR